MVLMEWVLKLFNSFIKFHVRNWIIVSYICVLNACSHSGLIDEACQIFQKIPFDQRTEHIYTTMVKFFEVIIYFY